MQTTIKIDLIEKYIKDNNLTKTEFCNQCKISLLVLNKIYKNDTDFDVINLFRIARVLNIEVYKLFNK